MLETTPTIALTPLLTEKDTTIKPKTGWPAKFESMIDCKLKKFLKKEMVI